MAIHSFTITNVVRIRDQVEVDYDIQSPNKAAFEQQATQGKPPTAAHKYTSIIPLAAFDDRLYGYGLPDRHAAFVAIIKEHAKSILAIPDGTNAANPLHNNFGGLLPDSTVSVTVPAQHHATLNQIFKTF